MQPVQEDNDYLVLAAYFSGTQSVGVIPAPGSPFTLRPPQARLPK